jgi:hypothetical protein
LGRASGGPRRLPPTDFWFQRLIAQGIAIGIGKRDLLSDYYPDELPALFAEYAAIQGLGEADEEFQDVRVDVLEFLRGG